MRLEDPQGHDLAGKVVVLSAEHYKGDQEARRFRCDTGFGCKPHSHGNAVFGQFMSDGERCRIERWQVESVEEGDRLDGLFEQLDEQRQDTDNEGWAEGKGS